MSPWDMWRSNENERKKNEKKKNQQKINKTQKHMCKRKRPNGPE